MIIGGKHLKLKPVIFPPHLQEIGKVSILPSTVPPLPGSMEGLGGLKGVFSDFMIDASKNTNDPLIPKMVSFFQNSTSGQRGSLSGMIKTSQTTSISSQTKSKKPLNPHLYLSNHIAYLLNHICNLSNHITYLSNQIVPLPNQIIPLSNHIMIWFGRFSGCRKCYRSYRK